MGQVLPTTDKLLLYTYSQKKIIIGWLSTSNGEVTSKLCKEICDLNNSRSCGNRIISHSSIAASQDNIALTAD